MTPLELASRSFRVIETGDPDLANQLIDPAFVNQETADDPEDVDAESWARSQPEQAHAMELSPPPCLC
jgi:hypothetical protein